MRENEERMKKEKQTSRVVMGDALIADKLAYLLREYP